MLESFTIVGTQVLILFIMIGLGFFGGKKKFITQEGVRSINDILLYFVTPCVIIDAFQRTYDPKLLKNLLLSMLASLISHLLCYALGFLFVRSKDMAKRKVLRFTVVYSNCGFMALPLIEALLGSEGVFYGAGYLAVFNIMVWSFGQYSMGKGQEGFENKKAVLNPGVLSVVVGLIFFFTSTALPEVIGSPIAYIADLNTPLPMLIIGYTISKLDFSEIFHLTSEWIALLLRLIVAPGLLLVILYFAGYRGTLLMSSIVSAATPVAAISVMFSIKFRVDETMASKLVAISSLFSVFTMTIVIGIAKYLA